MLTSNNADAKRQSLVYANSIAIASIDFLPTYPARDDEPIVPCLISYNHKNPYIVAMAFTEVRLIILAMTRCGSRRIHVAHGVNFVFPCYFFYLFL